MVANKLTKFFGNCKSIYLLILNIIYLNGFYVFVWIIHLIVYNVKKKNYI